MHTSTRLTSSDFHFQKVASDQHTPISFAHFCPDYHELDRVGVVSPNLSDGVLKVGRTLLALTTAFYDAKRAQSGDFFDYPQHFAFVGQDNIKAHSEAGEPWGAWSWLDVWPENKWISAPPTAMGMLRTVFDTQINRLFWPSNLWPTTSEEPLPDHAYRMLKTRLKMVYLYGNPKHDLATIQVSGNAAVERILVECIDRLPENNGFSSAGSNQDEDHLVHISTERFVQQMGFQA